MEYNIHIQLPPSIRLLACDLNSSIHALSPSEILFSIHPDHIPHITLTMGRVLGTTQVTELHERAASLAGTIHSFTLETTRAYLAEPSRKFVFLDVAPKDVIFRMKEAAYDAFSDLLSIPWAGQPDNDPHITIAYITQNQQQTESFLRNSDCRSSGLISSIGLAEMGSRGTCCRVLESFVLREAE